MLGMDFCKAHRAIVDTYEEKCELSFPQDDKYVLNMTLKEKEDLVQEEKEAEQDKEEDMFGIFCGL